MDDSGGGGQIGSCLSGLLFLVGSKVLHPTLKLPGSWFTLPQALQLRMATEQVELGPGFWGQPGHGVAREPPLTPVSFSGIGGGAKPRKPGEPHPT